MSSSFTVADMTIHRIVELEAPFLPALEMLPSLTPELLAENRSWLRSAGLDSNDVFMLCYQTYIVRTPHHNILIDSCLGNHKSRSRPEWNMRSGDGYMSMLAAAGLSTEDIDFVMCTHLHDDHVGWNTKLRNGEWVPTFPNATYVFNRSELDVARAADNQSPYSGYQDSVLPIIRAGRARIVEDEYQLGDHVRMLATPGHTAGHVSFGFGKREDHVVMTGDMIHVALQMKYPELSFARDKDPGLAATTRRAFLERYCDTPTLCCTAHFPSPSMGLIKRWQDGYRLVNPFRT